VFVEKPVSTTVADAQSLNRLATDHEVLLGAAADTFLGSAGQTARAAIDAGAIGEPIGAIAIVRHSKAERWHPDPSFLFEPGGGPALDWGPYHLAALMNLLGPIKEVSGHTRIGTPERIVTAPGRRVDRIKVTVPTHVSGTLIFDSGAICTVMLSFDVWESELPHIEVYGSEGTLSLPNPDLPDGDVRVRRNGEDVWRVLEPVVAPSAPMHDTAAQHLRGLGVVDMVGAIGGRPHRASGILATHVLDALDALERSSQTGRHIRLATSCDRPTAVPRTDPVGMT
jgi:predicted dehydrogenase